VALDLGCARGRYLFLRALAWRPSLLVGGRIALPLPGEKVGLVDGLTSMLIAHRHRGFLQLMEVIHYDKNVEGSERAGFFVRVSHAGPVHV
jgi:hypothetical protein